jgi:hypothetical protein
VRTLAIAAAALLFTGAASAQSGISTPDQPGSGYQIPSTPSTTQAPEKTALPPENLSGINDPSKPGSGYQVPETMPRQVPDSPKGEGVADPSRPGSGYGTGR